MELEEQGRYKGVKDMRGKVNKDKQCKWKKTRSCWRAS